MQPNASPRSQQRGRILWGSVVFFLLVGVALLIPLPRGTRWQHALIDLVHAPLFLLVSWWTCRLIAAGKRLSVFQAVAVLLMVVSLGSVLEFMQTWVGRNASISDAMANALGGLAGVLAFASQSVARPALFRAAAALLLIAGIWPSLRVFADVFRQWREFPVLASFERRAELELWDAQLAELEFTDLGVTHGSQAMMCSLDTGRYPGVTMQSPWPRWDGFETLEFSLWSDGHEPWPLTLKIVDEAHNKEVDDRFHARIWVRPGQHTVRIPLQAVQLAPRGRLLDLNRIRYFQLFAVDLKQPRRFVIDHFHLE